MKTKQFKDGQRVWTYDFALQKVEGTIYENKQGVRVAEYGNKIPEYYIEFDDGGCNLVLDPELVHVIEPKNQLKLF